MEFKMDLKDSQRTVASIEVRCRPFDQRPAMTIHQMAEGVLRIEKLIEQVTGFRCHIAVTNPTTQEEDPQATLNLGSPTLTTSVADQKRDKK